MFPDSAGGRRDASDIRAMFRQLGDDRSSWVTTHVFRRTAATVLDEAGLSPA